MRSEKRQRTRLVAVRFTPAEHRLIAATASQFDISLGQLIRNALAEALPELDELDA